MNELMTIEELMLAKEYNQDNIKYSRARIGEIDSEIIKRHRATLDDPNGEELPEKYIRGVRALGNRQWGTLIESRRYAKDKLYSADENCNHQIVMLPSGIGCTRCPGWYCA